MDPPGQRSIDQADLVAATAQFAWPPAFSYLAVSVQDLMAADTLAAHPPRPGAHWLVAKRLARRSRPQTAHAVHPTGSHDRSQSASAGAIKRPNDDTKAHTTTGTAMTADRIRTASPSPAGAAPLVDRDQHGRRRGDEPGEEIDRRCRSDGAVRGEAFSACKARSDEDHGPETSPLLGRRHRHAHLGAVAHQAQEHSEVLGTRAGRRSNTATRITSAGPRQEAASSSATDVTVGDLSVSRIRQRPSYGRSSSRRDGFERGDVRGWIHPRN